MKQAILLLALAAFVYSTIAPAGATGNLNFSRSNINRAGCPNAGGTWRHGDQGGGCYVPVTPKVQPQTKTAPGKSKTPWGRSNGACGTVVTIKSRSRQRPHKTTAHRQFKRPIEIR